MRRVTWNVCSAALAAAMLGAITLPAQAPAGAAASPQVSLNVLLIGSGSSDPTTAAWQAALTTEGVAFTEVTTTGGYGAEAVTLPALTTGTSGNFNGVVLADSPSAFAAGQLTALDTYESTFAVRQIDGYVFPTATLGANETGAGALDGTTAQVTPAGLVALPQLKGTIPFDTGSYGYTASVVAGAPFTPWITNSSGVLAGLYQHPSTDPQANVSELELFFDYNASQLQWLLLAPGLINWVTQDAHLGLYRNYFGQDVDDNFIADNEWSSQYQCTPAATDPVDFTCPAGVAGNPLDTPGNVQMTSSDVDYVAAWEQQTGIKLNLAFNGVGACTAPAADEESTANCTGSITDNGITYTDPGQVVDATVTDGFTDDSGLIDELLKDKADFNWVIHTWSHEFLGCNVFQAQAVNSVTANPSGGSFTTGNYSYEITAATAYGESDPSLPQNVTVATGGSVSLAWPDATNGSGTTGTPSAGIAGPTLAQEEAIHTGGTGFWGYYIYREDPGSTSYGLVAQVPEDPTGATAVYNYTDTGATTPGGPPSSAGNNPTATNPGIDCSSAANSWDPANDPANTTDDSIDTEIALDQAWATANDLPNYSPSVVVTGEHSGIENPNMPAALANVGITTFATDASRQPAQYSLGSGATIAESAPRYPSNIYYNASNWPDEMNEYNTLYVAQGDSLDDAAYPGDVGHCDDTSATTCITTPATEATILASESRIMLSHVLNNDPRVGYAHQTDLIGPATLNGSDYGYTLLSLLNSMLGQYNSWTNTPLIQMTDATDAQTLGLQSAWSSALASGDITASETNGIITVTNTTGNPVSVPVTAPLGTTSGAAAYGQVYGGAQSTWTSLASGASLVLSGTGATSITSAASATSLVAAPFSFTVTTSGPVPALSESGALPSGITFVDNNNGTATLAGTSSVGSGGSYPFTITATSAANTVTQSFTLANDEAPLITSLGTAAFATKTAGTFTVTTSGYPAPVLSEVGALPKGLTFAAGANGTATISGTPAATTVGSSSINLTATNATGTATQLLALTVALASAPAITSSATASFTLGTSGSFTVTSTGTPLPTISTTTALPAGLTLVANADGTATISGTPTASGTKNVKLTAANGINPKATQTLVLTVSQGSAITSAASDSVNAGKAFTFHVTATGFPLPTLTESGTLPSGVTFLAGAAGKATISGTAATGTFGSYPLTLTATNATGSVNQSFTLTVSQVPAITSAATASATTGSAFSVTVTTTGSPAPTMTETSTLPAGLTFTDNANGTATIAGTPTGSGSSNIKIVATNSAGTARQTLVLTISASPQITSANTESATHSKSFTFHVTATGFPLPILSESGTLPSGVTFVAGAAGKATLSGTPSATSAGTYPITISATSSAGTITQSFSLVVK
jgi:hypothetical protein